MGDTWRIWEVLIFIRRTRAIWISAHHLLTRGCLQSVRSSSDARCSSDDCDQSRIRKTQDTVWTLQKRPISIRRATQTKYVDALEALDFRHDLNCDWIPIVIRIGKLTCGHVELFGASDRSISIGRLGRLMEEIHDRGAIELRSRCDQAAIVAPSSRNHRHDHQMAFI